MPFYGIQSTYISEIRGMCCLPGISVMEEQPFCQSQRSLLHSRFMKDGSQRKHVCSQICMLFSCECTGKHHAVLPCCSLASFPKIGMIIAHSGDNTDNACRDWSRQVSCGAQRLQLQGSLLCPCPGHLAVHSPTALVSLPNPDDTLRVPHIALPVFWTLAELWVSAEQG